MAQYIGLDVSLKETFISVRENGRRIWRGKCPSDPKLLAEEIRKRAPDAERIVFETGPLSTWYYHELKAAGLPAICIDGRPSRVRWSSGLPKGDKASGRKNCRSAPGSVKLAVGRPGRVGDCRTGQGHLAGRDQLTPFRYSHRYVGLRRNRSFASMTAAGELSAFVSVTGCGI